MNSTLQERHALISGGGRGIGAAIAVALATHGARVTLLGRSAGPLQATVARLGGAAGFVTADVTDPTAVAAAVAAVAWKRGLARVSEPKDPLAFMRTHQYQPVYKKYI